jgi:hypothetical protein
MVEGESDLKHAMAWDEIPAATYVRAKPDVRTFIPALHERFEQRLTKDQEFQKLVADIKQYGERRKMKTISLNLQQREQLRKEDEAWAKRSDEVLNKTKQGKMQISHEMYKPTEDLYTRITFDVLSDLITYEQHPDHVAHEAAAVPAATTQGVVE